MTAYRPHHAVPVLITVLVVTVAASASAQDEEPTATASVVAVQSTTPELGPRPKVAAPTKGTSTGFAMDARLVQSLGGEGFFTSEPLPAVALGYRGDRVAVLVGPYYRKHSAVIGMGAVGGLGAIGTLGGTSATSSYGGTLVGELVLARSDDKRTAAHAVASATLAETKASASYGGGSAEYAMPETWGLAAGIGLRHWLSPNLAFSVELGEGYRNAPLGLAGQRLRDLVTFGALGVSLVL